MATKLSYNLKFCVSSVIVMFCVGLVLVPQMVLAATFFFQPSSGELAAGDTFFLEARLDSEGEEINAAEAHIIFPKDIFEVLDIDYGGSFLTLWPREPSFSNSIGTVDFTAGTPLGFNGKDGIIGRILFKAKTVKEGTVISFKEGRALLADGKGTATKVSFSESIFNISESGWMIIAGFSSPSHPDQLKWYRDRTFTLHWDVEDGIGYSYTLSRDVFARPDDVPDMPVGDIEYKNLEDGIYYFHLCEIRETEAEQYAGQTRKCDKKVTWRAMIDTAPPEDFEALFNKGGEESGGKPYLSFSTQDLTSGLHRNDLCHIKQAQGSEAEVRDCRQVASPVILAQEDLDQELLAIRAYDKAGNFQEARVSLSKPLGWRKFAVIGGVAAVIVVFAKLISSVSRVKSFLRVLFKGE